MNKLLVLLRSSRTSRRDAALGRMAAARQQLDAAAAALDQSAAALQQALVWQQDVQWARGRAADAQWRCAMLPSCEAMVAQRRVQLDQAQHSVTLRQQAMNIQRTALSVCERALIRTDELERLSVDQARSAERLQEQSQDDDMAAAVRCGASAVATVRATVRARARA